MKLHHVLAGICALLTFHTSFAQTEDFATILVKAKEKPITITVNGEPFDHLKPGKTLSFGVSAGDKKRIVLEDNEGNKHMKEILVKPEDKGITFTVQFPSSTPEQPETAVVSTVLKTSAPAEQESTKTSPVATNIKTTTAAAETKETDEQEKEFVGLKANIRRKGDELNEMIDKIKEGRANKDDDDVLSNYSVLKSLLDNYQAFLQNNKGKVKSAEVFSDIKKVVNSYEAIKDGKRPSSNNVITAFKKSRDYDLHFWINSKNVTDTTIDERSTLFYALDNNCNEGVIKYLLKISGGKNDYVNYDKYTFMPPNQKYYMMPLTLACINGDTNVINALIDAKARLCPEGLDEYRTKEQSKFLWQQFGSNAAVRTLIKRRMPDFPDPYTQIENAVNKIMDNMALVEGGTFKMGCEGSRFDCGRAWPAVELTVPSFYLSKYEVTQQLWEMIMEQNPSNNKCADCPVEQVSWDDVQAFILKLNKASGKNFRLPTEKEWEFAARGGNQSHKFTYSGSNNVDSVAWNKTNTIGIKPVGQKQPNELGLYDMSGNVFEWCSSFFTETLEVYQKSPDGETSGTTRVTKGGSWRQDEFYSQPSRRAKAYPDMGTDDTGFRLALDK